MINTSVAPFVLQEDSQQMFSGCSISCEPTYYEIRDIFGVRLNILDSLTTETISYGYMEVTAAEVDAETGSGTGETDLWFNALQKAVKAKLAAITDNSGVTFTVV